MSFNVRYGTADDGPHAWPHRREALIQCIRAYDPDVLGVQEALVGQLYEIGEALPHLGMVGNGRDDGVHGGEHAAIFFHGLSSLDSGTFWFSETPNVPGSKFPGCYHPRICTWSLFQDRDGGVFKVYNLHLDNEAAAARHAAVEQVLTQLDRREPSIVLGDFNAGESDSCIERMREVGLRDSFRVVHPEASGVGTYHGFGAVQEHDKIDYIWVDRSWRAVEAEILSAYDRWPSDHHPVTAILEWA